MTPKHEVSDEQLGLLARKQNEVFRRVSDGVIPVYEVLGRIEEMLSRGPKVEIELSQGSPEALTLLIEDVETRLRDLGGPQDVRSISRLLGIAPASFVAWRKGRRFPRDHTLQRIAGKLFADEDARRDFIHRHRTALGGVPLP